MTKKEVKKFEEVLWEAWLYTTKLRRNTDIHEKPVRYAMLSFISEFLLEEEKKMRDIMYKD